MIGSTARFGGGRIKTKPRFHHLPDIGAQHPGQTTLLGFTDSKDTCRLSKISGDLGKIRQGSR
jgi:hypothetical protein